MATIVAFKDFKIESGKIDSTPGNTPASICAISGSSGYESIYFGVDIWVGMALLDDNSVYFGHRSGRIGSTNPTLIHGSVWQAWMYHSNRAFNYVSGEWPKGLKYFNMGTFEGQTGNIFLSIPSSAVANRLTVGADSSTMTNWRYAGKLSDDPNDEDYFERDAENLYYHLAIPVNNSGGNVNDTRASSTRIAFYWPEIFDYFPWARYQTLSNETDYWSHNRTSPNKGSLQRYTGTQWDDCKNKAPENAAENEGKGQRYDGSKWYKSPKLGKNK